MHVPGAVRRTDCLLSGLYVLRYSRWEFLDRTRSGPPRIIIAAGDCGHGFKFAPVLGEIIADAVEEKPNPILQKFRWRPDVRAGSGTDVARFNPQTPNAQRRTSNFEIRGG